MNKLITTAAIALLTFTTATVHAKDKHKKKHDDDHGKYSHYDGKHRSNGRVYYGDDRNYNQLRTRTVYVIRDGRPVRQVVYIDGSGQFYRQPGGRPVYIGNRYFESYPSKYYTSDGRRRVNVRLPF
jgi:hypothetical protein